MGNIDIDFEKYMPDDIIYYGYFQIMHKMKFIDQVIVLTEEELYMIEEELKPNSEVKIWS